MNQFTASNASGVALLLMVACSGPSAAAEPERTPDEDDARHSAPLRDALKVSLVLAGPDRPGGVPQFLVSFENLRIGGLLVQHRMDPFIGAGPGNLEFEVVRGPIPIPLERKAYVHTETEPDYVRWVYLVPGSKFIQPLHMDYQFPPGRYSVRVHYDASARPPRGYDGRYPGGRFSSNVASFTVGE